jgi:superfamily I DNA and/or RNA helicase
MIQAPYHFGFIIAAWNNTLQKVTIGVVLPYSSQVNAIKSRLGTKYDNCHGFSVRVASIDGFQVKKMI